MKYGSFISKKLIGLVAVSILVASPALSAAATDGSTDIEATVHSAISVTTSGKVDIDLIPGGSPRLSVAYDTISVSTNNSAGYILHLANDDSDTALTGSQGGAINPHTGIPSAPSPLTLNGNTGSWGFAVAGLEGFDSDYVPGDNQSSNSSKWAGVPSAGAGVQIKNHVGTADNDETVVYYGVYINSQQQQGTYTDTVVYTATAK